MVGTRERLLTAAASVFAERGYHAASVQDVADAVGIQKPSVYKHFRSKQDLLLGCLAEGHTLREQVLDEVGALESAPAERLHEYLRRYTRTMLAHRELSAVFAREWVHLAEPLRTADLQRRRQRRHALLDLVRAAAADGADAALAATYLKGAMHSTLDWYHDEGPDPLPAFAKTVADLGCRLVAVAPRAAGPAQAVAPDQDEARPDRAVGARAPRSRRDAIDDAALRIVRHRGFAATTVQAVAAEAGVLKGSVYHYVASKDELLMRIFEAAHLELTTIVGTVAQLDASPEEQLVELVRLQVEWFLENPDQAVVLFREWPFLTGAHRELVAGRRRGLERFAGRLFEQGCAAGEITPGAGARVTVRFAMGAANAVAQWYRPAGGWEPARVAAGYAGLTRGLLRAP